MYPGQQINIRSGSIVQPPAPCRQPALISEAPVPVVALPIYNALVIVSGSYPMITPGSGLQVTALNFPPNTLVNVAIGPRTTGYTIVASGVTDANGTLSTQIILPTTTPDSQTPWVVVVSTTTATPIQVMSKPFFIGF